MSNELVKNSKIVKKDADLLLKKSDMLKVLSNYGEVFVRGSYELDLMVDGDIDIYIVNTKLDKKLAIKALNELIERNDFRGYMFYDFVKRRKKGFPKGYYLGVKTRFKDRKWKIDIWFMKSMDNVSDKFMKKVLAGLDDEKRIKILELKNKVKTDNVGIPSYLIYLAVIENNVSELNDLKLFADNKN